MSHRMRMMIYEKYKYLFPYPKKNKIVKDTFNRKRYTDTNTYASSDLVCR